VGIRVYWRRIQIINGYICFATGQPSPQALSSNRYLLRDASILRSRTRYSLMSSHYCTSCITFSISLSCCSKFGKNSFEIVLYQYIRRYHLISKNGQNELCRDKISFSKLYLQRKFFLVTFLWHVHFFSHWWGQT
jgi:hypothetical protein